MHRNSTFRRALLVAGTVLFTIGGMLAGITPANADTTTLVPVSLTTGAGSIGSGQSVGNLRVQDQSGIDDDWDEYVEFRGHTANTAYSGQLTYTLPPSVPASSVSGVQLRLNYRGPSRAEQQWQWSVYNFTTGSWVVLGDNTGATSWGIWKLLTFNAPGPQTELVQAATGNILIRITSSNAVDDADLDYAGLTVTHAETTPTPEPDLWLPAQTDRWQYQLQPNATGSGTAGGIRLNLCTVAYSGGSCVSPTVYDIDLYAPDHVTPNTAAVQAIHASGKHAICYISAGTWEDWRPDAGDFPESVKGNDVDGGPDGTWPGEKWLDVRNLAVLLPLMDARVAKCEQAGFDSVEFDNVDSYQNDPGFVISPADQLAYNRALADLAHDHGLSAGLKNDLGQVADLIDWFDYAINESCQEWDECDLLDQFLVAGKAVFQVEYTDEGATAAGTCPPANAAGRGAILKTLDLKATPWRPCR
ncbi:hypothetical protein Aple_091130 [Acrocarpospora pleiomorpha]|uniref:Uncharacterized protein n=1 Tax=Acrocarpospora pleiomorpha TaxID=90975 RepID=A0A5M3XYL0_9ACTN|nr:endo alpha-1,4 polygalactosaminidase [Acrocarpospora pleiomorpha]GES26214.1 hypothetical protein Aple_091130 [Acrocarpospora pleiomorpha]